MLATNGMYGIARYIQSLYSECGILEITKDEMSKYYSWTNQWHYDELVRYVRFYLVKLWHVFWRKIYNWLGGTIFLKREDTVAIGRIELTDAKSSNKMLRKMFQENQGNMYSLSYPAYVFCLPPAISNGCVQEM